MDGIQMHDIMMKPVCIGCGSDVEFIIELDGNGVVMKCNCKERFLLMRQYLFLEGLVDEIDRSIFLNFVHFGNQDLDVVKEKISKIRIALGVDISNDDKKDILLVLGRVGVVHGI